MDEAIRTLKSTTFFGRRLTRRQIAEVQKTVRDFPALSRRELGHTICEHLGWHAPSGTDSIQSALGLLEALAEVGVVTLPRKDETRAPGRQRRPVRTARSEAPARIDGALARLLPLEAAVVEEPSEVALWNELVDRHHYLGYRRPVGPHLRYAIADRDGRWLGCMLFQFAARSLPCRDDFVGWDAAARRRRLHLVVGHSRWLILPWVRVDNLASKALSLVLRRLADDWQARHGYRPVLVETFVDPERFDGACYRAANWTPLGATRGKGSARPPKTVFVRPLEKGFRSVLTHGRAPVRRWLGAAPGPSDAFVDLWHALTDALVAVSGDFDRRWRKRQRVLNTMLVALFVFRLVLSKGHQGYQTALAELWEHCRAANIPLPRARPVTAAAMGNARAKVHEDLFRELHAEVLRRADATDEKRRWKGHRLYAVDGSKLNLPRGLLDAGYRVPSDNAHYPQGLLSCLYQLRSRLPVDFDLIAHADERQAARAHLDVLSPGDVVVYDRGYFSFAMLRAHVERGLHPVFRLTANACAAAAAFARGGETDAVVGIDPGDGRGGIRLRLVRYEIANQSYFLGTTLLDRGRYRVADLSKVYHARWGIEELYKTSEQTLRIERFHGKSERKVKQELFAHFVLITMTRLFSNHGEDLLEAGRERPAGKKLKVNFRSAMQTLGRHLEALLLRQAKLVRDVTLHVFDSIVQSRQAERPGRSYPRVSRRPIGKWKPGKPAKATASAYGGEPCRA